MPRTPLDDFRDLTPRERADAATAARWFAVAVGTFMVLASVFGT